MSNYSWIDFPYVVSIVCFQWIENSKQSREIVGYRMKILKKVFLIFDYRKSVIVLYLSSGNFSIFRTDSKSVCCMQSCRSLLIHSTIAVSHAILIGEKIISAKFWFIGIWFQLVILIVIFLFAKIMMMMP